MTVLCAVRRFFRARVRGRNGVRVRTGIFRREENSTSPGSYYVSWYRVVTCGGGGGSARDEQYFRGTFCSMNKRYYCRIILWLATLSYAHTPTLPSPAGICAEKILTACSACRTRRYTLCRRRRHVIKLPAAVTERTRLQKISLKRRVSNRTAVAAACWSSNPYNIRSRMLWWWRHYTY